MGSNRKIPANDASGEALNSKLAEILSAKPDEKYSTVVCPPFLPGFFPKTESVA
jgi:hypothetical protein